MRAPRFWWRETPSPAVLALAPVSLAYGAVAGRRMRESGETAPVPVVCVGNFTAGGTGKTPTALKVAALLRAAGETPTFLTRGYGGRLKGPVRVAPDHRPEDVGDEPLLLARAAPTVVSRDRPAGARLAAQHGASVVVMDDGLQNPSLAKDLSLAVVDGATGFGNGWTLPAGPLRAPLAAQWPRVDAVLVIGAGRAGDRAVDEARRLAKPVWRGRLAPAPAAADRVRDLRVLAFAGIGRPEKFFATLRACGAHVEAERAFPDHHSFTATELAALRDEAARGGLALATTEKDAIRIGPAADILVLPVELELEDEAGLLAFLRERLRRRA